MEQADEIEWYGNSKERFLERALERENWGNYHGHSNLGKRLIEEVVAKVNELTKNLNLYSERENEERVVPLTSGFVLIYKKEELRKQKELKFRLLIIDIRKSY